MSDIVTVISPAPMSFSSTVQQPTSTVTIVGSGQGVAGPPGPAGEGIQNFTGDPTVAYILART